MSREGPPDPGAPGPPARPGAGAPPAAPSSRERTVQALCKHFARDHLELAELERRLDVAYAAGTEAELRALVADLPALELAPPEGGEETTPAPRVDPAREAAAHDLVVAVMGGADRKGSWTPARSVTALALMGGAELDFRDAVFAAPVTEVRAFALMGGVEIVVPPGVRVESNGVGLLGAFEHLASGPPAGPEVPLLRISGLALMGGVEVKVRLPGETEREAKRRLREERRRRLGSERG